MSPKIWFRSLLSAAAISTFITPAAFSESHSEFLRVEAAVKTFQGFFQNRSPELNRNSNLNAAKVNIESPEAVANFETGQQFFWSRRGQLNYSCASCHVGNAGKRLAGETIPPALGLGIGFPKTATNDEPHSLHQQYQICNTRTRARPFALNGPEYKTLEYYLAAVSHGVTNSH